MDDTPVAPPELAPDLTAFELDTAFNLPPPGPSEDDDEGRIGRALRKILRRGEPTIPFMVGA